MSATDTIPGLMRKVWRGILAIQGPPGTGKSVFTANIVVRRASAGVRTVVTAHSNGVCVAISGKIQDRISKLRDGVKVPISVLFQHATTRPQEMAAHIKRRAADGNRPLD
ncbi:hypothetical protein PG991_012139 [Apiospora marii]|uniref:DNA2/NAM7 helicase helicase domain-containing protein n=1 Tax=Apiospora marii TaxID=335849 RepID=A0ABR1R964_9PEZI